MKKRILLVFMMLFSLVGFISCTEQPTTGSFTVTVLSAPTNLSVSGTVLSWNAVTNATEYIVYAGGVQITTVATNSFDFSSIASVSTVFTVAATATGYGKSPASFGFSYTAGAGAEAAIAALFLANDMEVPDYVVTALAQNGMTAAKLSPMIDDMMAMVTQIQTAEGDITLTNQAIRDMLADLDDIDAMVQTLIDILPSIIDETIESNNDEIDYLETQITGDEFWDSYYEDSIDRLEADNLRLLDIKTAILENETEFVTVLTNEIEYLIEFHAAFTTSILQDILGILESETLNATEIIVVKAEVLGVLENNLPSASDLTMLYDLGIIIMEAFGGTTSLTTMLSDMTDEMANTELLMMDLMISFLETIDVAFVNELETINTTAPSSEMLMVEIQILMLEYFKAFKDANPTLFEAIGNSFTEAQKLSMFNEFKTNFDTYLLDITGDQTASDVFAAVFEDLTYLMITSAGTVYEDLLDDQLNFIVATNGEFLRLTAILEGFTEEYDWIYASTIYSNTVLNETYANYTEMLNSKDEYDILMMEQVVMLLDATFMNLTDVELGIMIDMIIAMLPESTMVTELMLTALQVDTLVASGDTMISSIAPDLIDLSGNLTDYIIASTLIDDLLAAHNAAITYYTTTYGDNYRDYQDVDYDLLFGDDPYLDYAIAIVVAEHLNLFMVSGNITLVDGILTDFYTFMKTPEMLIAAEMTLAEVQIQETDAFDAVDDAVYYANIIKTYSVATLTVEQKANIDLFLGIGDQTE
jgi:hypothetical protein